MVQLLRIQGIGMLCVEKRFAVFFFCALFCLLLGFYSMCGMALIENHFNGLGHSLGFSFFFCVNCSS